MVCQLLIIMFSLLFLFFDDHCLYQNFIELFLAHFMVVLTIFAKDAE